MPAARRSLVLAYATCALIWGTTWYAIRVCVRPGDGVPTYEALALRFIIASALLLPLAWRFAHKDGGWPKDRRTWGWLCVAGLLDALGYVLVYLGEERISGGLAAVIYGCQPLLLATWAGFTRARPRRRDVIGALVALAGVIILFLDRIDVSAAQAVGVSLVFGSVVVSSIYALIVKRHGEGVSALATTAIFITVTAVALTVCVLIRGPRWPAEVGVAPLVALGYLAVMGTVVAFVAYFWLLARVSVMVIGTLVFVFPLIAVGVDLLFEPGHVFGGRALIGVVVTLGGLAIALTQRPAPAGA